VAYRVPDAIRGSHHNKVKKGAWMQAAKSAWRGFPDGGMSVCRVDLFARRGPRL